MRLLMALLDKKLFSTSSSTSSVIKTTPREIDVLPTRKLIKPRKRPSQMQRPTEQLVRTLFPFSINFYPSYCILPANSVGRGSYVSCSDVSLMTLSNINLNLWAKPWLSLPSAEKHAWSEVQSGHQQTQFIVTSMTYSFCLLTYYNSLSNLSSFFLLLLFLSYY